MAAKDNSFNITGVLFAKPVRIVPNTKEPDKPPYEFKSIILEITIPYTYKAEDGKEGYHTKSTFPEFSIPKNMPIDSFDIGDFIDVRFSIDGKKVNDSWHKTSLLCNYIKFADLDSDRPTHKGKVTVTPSDPEDLSSKEPVLFSDKKDYDDLPF